MTGLQDVPHWENKHAASTTRAANEGPGQAAQKEPLVFC